VKTRNGASSPWVESYEITKRYSFNDERYRFEINYTDTNLDSGQDYKGYEKQ
jgi:hypothetical protein